VVKVSDATDDEYKTNRTAPNGAYQIDDGMTWLVFHAVRSDAERQGERWLALD